MKSLFYLFLIYYLLNLTYANTVCNNTITDCFTCSGKFREINDVNYYCQWKDGICQNGQKTDFNPRYLQYENCNDEESEKIRDQYCGKSLYTSSDGNASYSLPINSGMYGRNDVLCIYEYINEDEDASVYVSIRLNAGVLFKMNMLIEAVFYDESVSSKFIDNSNFLVMIEKSFKTNIYFWSNTTFTSLPFTIHIKSQKQGISVTLIVTIVLIVAACVICSVSIWLFSRKIARRNALAAQNMGNIYVGGIRIHPGETEEMLKKRKMKQLADLLNTVLVAKPYIKQLGEYNLNCTICFEEYNLSSSVCLTECKHVFHYECLKSWLTKNLLNPKCPNCNHIVLPDVNTLDQIPNSDLTQSIPFVSGRASHRIRGLNNNSVVNNFVEGNSGGIRVSSNSTNRAIPINSNSNNN